MFPLIKINHSYFLFSYYLIIYIFIHSLLTRCLLSAYHVLSTPQLPTTHCLWLPAGRCLWKSALAGSWSFVLYCPWETLVAVDHFMQDLSWGFKDALMDEHNGRGYADVPVSKDSIKQEWRKTNVHGHPLRTFLMPSLCFSLTSQHISYCLLFIPADSAISGPPL